MAFDYTDIVNTLEGGVPLSKEEKETLLNHPAPKLIGAIPFLANFEDADRYSLINLSAYLLGKRKVKAFMARPEDKESITRRLKAYNKPEHNFDVPAYKYGLALLEIMHLADQHHDQALDKNNKKFNLITDGGWNHDDMQKDLLAQANYLRKQVKPETLTQYDAIAPLSTVAKSGNW